MGEEAKQEDVKAEAKPEEKKEEPPQPPSPVILFVDLHCVGCAKKIEKFIKKIRGVEGVDIDMAQNQVTLKGIVDPQAVCNMVMKRTKRRVKVISPSSPAAEGEAAAAPQVVSSKVSGSTTVELNVDMHCEACAEQLQRKIIKMRGVQRAVTEFSTGKVTVTGTMDADKLVDYVYRRTKKQARIVPQPEPEPEKKEDKKEAEKPGDEPKPEEKKEENGEQKSEDKPEEKKEEENKENKGKEKGGSESKEGEVKKEGEEAAMVNHIIVDEESMKRMMYYYQPLSVIERLPPPQLFSDENPNACCIS